MTVLEKMAWVTEPKHGIFWTKDSQVKNHQQLWLLYLKLRECNWNQTRHCSSLSLEHKQELMKKLCEAGERISETIFVELFPIDLPGRFENFVVHFVEESFNPSGNITGLRLRLTNIEDSRKHRNVEGEQPNQHVAMPSRGKFERSSSTSKSFCLKNKDKLEERKRMSCYCCGKVGHIAKSVFWETKQLVKTREKGHLEVTCRSQCHLYKRKRLLNKIIFTSVDFRKMSTVALCL